MEVPRGDAVAVLGAAVAVGVVTCAVASYGVPAPVPADSAVTGGGISRSAGASFFA
ncbi:MAG: hypothetical protein ACREOG_17030 [Gemmatimonadaceae bacterium]